MDCLASLAMTVGVESGARGPGGTGERPRALLKEEVGGNLLLSSDVNGVTSDVG
jgi:hypothetical protein